MSGWARVCFVFMVCILPVGLGADSSALKAKQKAEALYFCR